MSGIIKATNLEVTTIKDKTNSNTAMTIDTSGNVSIKVAGAHALVDFGGNAYVSKTSGILQFDTIVENIGNHYSTSTYKFTCPVDGLYQTTIGAISQNDTDKYGMDLYKSDNRVRRNYTVYRTFQATNILMCSASDTLAWYLSGNSIALYEGTGIERYTYASYSLIYAT
tara:strand:- start:6068 stop:6574 length:507 start_codon:yes stop_codon:yes gene_type:complete